MTDTRGDAPGAAFTWAGVAYPWQMDHMGHLNVQFYAALFDQATWAFFAEFGLDPAYLRESGCAMAAVSQHTEYRHEVFAGDVLEVHTQLLAVTEKTVRFLHTLRRRPQGEVVATSELVAAHLDRAVHRAVPLTEPVRGRLLARLHS